MSVRVFTHPRKGQKNGVTQHQPLRDPGARDAPADPRFTLCHSHEAAIPRQDKLSPAASLGSTAIKIIYALWLLSATKHKNK